MLSEYTLKHFPNRLTPTVSGSCRHHGLDWMILEVPSNLGILRFNTRVVPVLVPRKGKHSGQRLKTT